MTVRFYDASGRAAHMEALIEKVTKAEEVLAITWPSEEGKPPSKLDAARLEYFRILLNRCAAGALKYRRILQLENWQADDAIRKSYDRLYLEHFSDMLATKAPRGAVQLSAAPLTLPGTYVVIDRAYFAWEICELGGDRNQRLPGTSRYSLQVSDSKNGGVSALASAWDALFSASSTRTVEAVELLVPV